MAIGCVTSGQFFHRPILLRETHWDWSWHQQEHCGRVLSDWLWVWCISITRQITRTFRDVCCELYSYRPRNYKVFLSLAGLITNTFQRTTSKTVSTWETFSVTCHYVSYIGHRKANFYLPLLTFQGATLYCLHCWLLEIYNDVMTDPNTKYWWWFSMLQFLTTLKISSCRWSQWFVFWARLSPLLHASSLILARMFFNGSCWFWTLKMLRTTWNPI